MEITLQEAADLDKMLIHMASFEDNVMFDVDEFKKEVFKEYTEWQIEHLLKLLYQYRPSVVRLSDYWYMIEPYGRVFNSRGGFTAIYNKQLQEHKQKAVVSQMEFENLELSVSKLKKELSDYSETRALAKSADRTGKGSLNVARWSMFISILSLLIILITILLTRYKIWPFDK